LATPPEFYADENVVTRSVCRRLKQLGYVVHTPSELSAKFGSVEVTVGLHPLMGAVQRLTQRAGAARAKEMALLGRRYPASVLERWNIVNFVVADENLDTATMVIAQELAHGPSIAHTATKRLVSVAVNEGLAAADEAMAEIQRPIIGSADFANAVRSYRENGIGMAEFEGR
jgi:enoyl-CoA hydratase/carnithine racemase